MRSGSIGPWIAGLLLVFMIGLGIAVRTQNFQRLGYTNQRAFPIESAQRFRYIAMAANEGGIPSTDHLTQYPDGFNTRTDTITQEYLFGYVYRLLSFTGLPLETLIRYFIRLFWLLTIIPIYLVVLYTTGSRSSALISSLFFAVAMPSLRRALGDQIYREHIAFLPLGLHLYYLLCALDSKIRVTTAEFKRNARSFYRCAIFSAVFLAVCLISWKANRFYYLTLTVFFALMMLSGSRRLMAVKLLAIFTVANIASSILFNTPLKYDLFPFSTGMMLSYALLAAGIVQLRFKRPLLSVAVLAAVSAVVFYFKPETGYYTHVWDTLFARLHYFTKPSDPSLLSFEARHYWVPPYISPTPFMFLNDFAVSLAAASIACSASLKRILKKRSSSSEELLLFSLVIFLLFYLLFYKLMTFLVFFTALFVGISFTSAMTMKGARRYATIGLVITALGLGVYQSQTWEGNFLARGLRSVGLKPMFIPQGVPDGATEELIEWFRNNTAEGEAVLAEFPVSTALLAYVERPVVLHALFEGVNRYRFREFSFALIGDERQLYDMMEKYRARYFVYSSHFLLRTDNNMSYRYTANALKINKEWTLYKMHFHPERLKQFELIYQNSAFRVFRLVEKGKKVISAQERYEPVFDESLLAGLRFKTPNGVTKEEAFLYTIVSAYSDVRDGLNLIKRGEGKEGLRLLERSIETFPFIPEAHTALADYYRSRGESEKAVDHLKKAHALDTGNWRQIVE